MFAEIRAIDHAMSAGIVSTITAGAVYCHQQSAVPDIRNRRNDWWRPRFGAVPALRLVLS